MSNSLTAQMLLHFFDYLSEHQLEYRMLHGYKMIFSNTGTSSDYDILLRKADFAKINYIVSDFCMQNDYHLVQMLHHGRYAKNFFVYDLKTDALLNIDLYGETSEQGVKTFAEDEAFKTINNYRSIPILRPHQEFINYLIKKISKGEMKKTRFAHLRSLYLKEMVECDQYLKKIFPNASESIVRAFVDSNHTYFSEHTLKLNNELHNAKKITRGIIHGIRRIVGRLYRPTGIAVAFLGPDGAGKSTVIERLIRQPLPFRRNDYFHLKPIQNVGHIEMGRRIGDPHGLKPYSRLVSYMKLFYFVVLYNYGWLKNVSSLIVQSSLVIFDRYYDDLLVDPKRFRLQSNNGIGKIIRYLIVRPSIYFVMTTKAEVIYRRKQEVPYNELERQIGKYRGLVNNRRYFYIDVDRDPEEIVLMVKQILMQKMNERY